MKGPGPKVTSLAAHVQVARECDVERRRLQARAIVAKASLDIIRDLRQLDAAIAELELRLVRSPDTATDARQTLEVMRSRRERLVGTEGRERVAVAEALAAYLTHDNTTTTQDQEPAKQTTSADSEDAPDPSSSPWG